MPRVAAISSCPRPANWRSSTTLAATGSSINQPVEGLVESEEVVVRVRCGLVDKVDSTQPTAPLLTGLAPCRLDQDTPHRLSRRGEEVTAAVPELRLLDVHEPQVGFMNQCRRLERMTGRLLCQPLDGQSTEFVVDQRQQLFGRLGSALLDRRENPSDVCHRWKSPGSSRPTSTRTLALPIVITRRSFDILIPFSRTP